MTGVSVSGGVGQVSAAGISTLVALAAVTVLLGVAAVVDATTERIPNRLLEWSAGSTLAAATVGGFGSLTAVLVGGLLAGVPMLIVLLSRGVGMGDVKMAGVVGGAGGLVHPFVGLVSVMVAALTVAAVGAITRRRRWALGPWLWTASVCTAAVVALRNPGGLR